MNVPPARYSPPRSIPVRSVSKKIAVGRGVSSSTCRRLGSSCRRMSGGGGRNGPRPGSHASRVPDEVVTETLRFNCLSQDPQVRVVESTRVQNDLLTRRYDFFHA